MAENSLSKIPYWDGKAENFGVYVSKIEAYAEFMGVGDALDPKMMANCPTKSEFAAIDQSNPASAPLVELYKANKNCALLLCWGRARVMVLLCWGKRRARTIPMG